MAGFEELLLPTALHMKNPKYRVFNAKSSQTPAFSTNWKFLAQCYASYACKNYARIEEFVAGKYEAVSEMAYAIRPSNN